MYIVSIHTASPVYSRPQNRLSRPLMIDLRQLSMHLIDKLDFWLLSLLSLTQGHDNRLD